MTSTLHDAVAFLKGAVARNLPGGAPSLYVFHEGVCYAQNAVALAAYPVPELNGTFGLDVSSFESALARMQGAPTIGSGDGTLVLRHGRLKTTIKILYADVPETTGNDDASWMPMAPALLDALRTVKPFISDQGTWQCGAKISEGKIMAANNRSVIEVQVNDLVLPLDYVILADDCVSYLCSAKEYPTEFFVTPHAMWFRWLNGAWLRCQLIAAEWSSIADRALEAGGTEAQISITHDWRSAVDDIIALGDGSITVLPQGLRCRTDRADADVEFETGVSTTTTWSKDVLQPVLKIADRWNPDAQGPARFYGTNIRGVVAGIRR